jgi:PAS domain S-box-containing protein
MPLFVPKDRKSLFRQFLAGMYDAVVITDPSGHIIEINPRAVEHFGYQLEEVLDRHISHYIPGLAPEVVQRIRKGLAGDHHVMVDADARTKDGGKIACEVAVSIIDLMDPGDLVFTIRNIERRRQVMNTLKSKANAFEAAHSALAVAGPDGRLREANPAFIEAFGLKDGEEACRKTAANFFPGPEFASAFEKAAAGERVAASVDAPCGRFEVLLAPNTFGRKRDGVIVSAIRS